MPPTYDPDRIICVACLAQDSPRLKMWREFFGAAHVPITRDQAQMTILPDAAEPSPCYFVDFSIFGTAGKVLIMAANQRRNNDPRITAMLNSDIYPIRGGEDVTTVRAAWRLWK